VINQEYYKADHPANPKGNVELRLAKVKPGKYHLVATKIGYRANDVQAAWRDLGSPAQLTRAQVATPREASAGKPVVSEQIQVGANGNFARRFDLHENDVWLVELRPL